MYIDVVSLFLNADHARVQYTTQYALTYALYRAGAAGKAGTVLAVPLFSRLIMISRRGLPVYIPRPRSYARKAESSYSAVQSTKVPREPIQTTGKNISTLRTDRSVLHASIHSLWQWPYHSKIARAGAALPVSPVSAVTTWAI